MKLLNTLFLIVVLCLTSCKDDELLCCTPPHQTSCDKFLYVNEIKYNQIATNNYTIINVVLDADCLEITLSSSGCDPNNWGMNFIASESVVETLPVKRMAKVELINNEACAAVFQKTMSFDLIPLKVEGQNQVELTIDGWSTPIMYTY